jgi:para-nitrobenzyl esterase
MEPERLLDAQHRVAARHAWINLVRPTTQRLFVYGPVADGTTLDGERLRDVRIERDDLPLLVGSNQDEWRAFSTRIDNPPSEQAILDDLATWVTDARAVWDFYRSRAPDLREAWTALSTDCLFTIPAIRLDDTWRQRSHASTYHYLFRWKPPLSDNRAAHSREIPFVFNTFHHRRGHMLGGFSPPLPLLRLVQASWAAFARSGAPSSNLEWPAYGRSRRTMALDAAPEVVDDPHREQRELWDSVRPAIG